MTKVDTKIISVIMPCYNCAKHLVASVSSVQAQTMKDWELVIVDDGSADLSWQTLQCLAAQDKRIRIFQQLNAGAAAARNRALREARGAYTAFLDSDDTWHPEFLEAMVSALDADPNAGIAYCGWQNIGLGKGREEPFIPPEYEDSNKTESLLGGCRWPIHGALVRSQIIRKAGCFDETLSSCMDYDLWLRLGTIHRLVRVPIVLAYYHHHGGEQITRNRARIAINHWRAQQKYLSTHPALSTSIGKSRILELTMGELLKRGYDCYWQRDLPAARKIFRAVMKQGYGTLRDWKYMLPAWLPESWYQWLIRQRDKHIDHDNSR
ncbi:MAG: glycosyltransferase [Gallionella sp.]